MDYKTRGGFKFENDGVFYTCFNCSTSVKYEPNVSRHSLSKGMAEVLTAFGIPETEYKAAVSSTFFKPVNETAPAAPPKPTEFPTVSVPLPPNCVNVLSNDSEWCELARDYLNKRQLYPENYTYFVTDHESAAGRIIIPYYFREKIIYWQGRSLDDELISPRYKNPVVEKDNIIFNMDELFRHTSEPLFVTEGPLDALSIGSSAVALAGSTLTEFRFRELLKAARNRKVIFVIDKNKNGYKLGQRVLNQDAEWYVSCFPESIDDANDALKKLGHLWLLSHLVSTAVRGFHGKVLLEMRCSKK